MMVEIDANEGVFIIINVIEFHQAHQNCDRDSEATVKSRYENHLQSQRCVS